MLNTFQDDPCCDGELMAAIGNLELELRCEWMCPVCGCVWKATIHDTIKHWEPVPEIALLRV